MSDEFNIKNDKTNTYLIEAKLSPSKLNSFQKKLFCWAEDLV